MNVDIPNLIRAAVPESEGRNARIISQHGTNYRDPGFLSQDFPRNPPKLYFTAESDEFDDITLADWRDEGFDVEYMPMGDDEEEYIGRLRALSRKNMAPCETFGIVAFGDAAAACLEHYHVMDNNPEYKLGLLIAYYPTSIPDPKGRYPNGITALVHLAAGEEIGVTSHSQMVGIQGKRRTTRRRVEDGLGTGATLRLAYPAYSYDAAPGFAEHDLDEYDRVSAELAWSRSLAAARTAFAIRPDLELVVDDNTQGKFFSRSLRQTMASYTTHRSPHVTNMPTLTGGIGTADLEKFYSRFFSNPPSLQLTLLSRTIGADRVVDELHVRFKHTQEMPWILPGVPPTDKRVEVVIVSIVTLRAGKLCHEHVYWDQASVLLQIGLLEPRLGPVTATKTGVERLPVVGREAARRALLGWRADEEGEADNRLIKQWNDFGGVAEDDDDENGINEDGYQPATTPVQNGAVDRSNGANGAAKVKQTGAKAKGKPKESESGYDTGAPTPTIQAEKGKDKDKDKAKAKGQGKPAEHDASGHEDDTVTPHKVNKGKGKEVEFDFTSGAENGNVSSAPSWKTTVEDGEEDEGGEE